MICKDLGEVAAYARVSNEVFRVMKRVLPGPFTFVLPGTTKLPNLLMMKRKTIGVRVPDNFITRAITTELGSPLLTTSVKGALGEDDEYITDPELIHEKYEHLVDLVIGGGYGKNVPSTVVDCTGEEMVVMRQGAGEL
jgi:tRNA threonylcarbamoyl adenosine modification protein (Sua5/YciO/YrdC/YwlC family)